MIQSTMSSPNPRSRAPVFLSSRLPAVSIKEIMPWVCVLIAALMVMTYLPDTVLWLPRLLGYKG